jgi:hypothetical protein
MDTGTNPLLGLLEQWNCDSTLTADGDADNINNVLEFAFGTNPFVSDNNPLATTGAANVSPGSPVIHEVTESADPFLARFVRRQSYVADKLTYTVEFSEDLVTWVAATDIPTVVASENGLDIVELPLMSTGIPVKFFRINVTFAP